MTYRAIKAFTVGTARGASSFEVGDEVSWPVGQLEQWAAMGLVAEEGKEPAKAAKADEPAKDEDDGAKAKPKAPAKRKRG